MDLGRTTRLVLQVILWWYFSVWFNVEAKLFLSRSQDIFSALLLSWMSLLVGGIGGLALSRNRQFCLDSKHAQERRGIFQTTRELKWISFLYLVGMISTNYSISSMSVGFVHTIKAIQPLFTLFWTMSGIAKLPNSHLSIGQIVCIFVVVGGVFLSSSAESTFSWSGLFWGMLSNFSLSAYSVLLKSSLSEEKDKETLFFQMSLLGSLMITPVLIVFDGRNGFDVFTNKSTLIAILYPSLAHFLFNFFSVSALEELTPIAHAITNVCKRIIIIVSASVILGNPTSSVGVLGGLLVVLGACTYHVLTDTKAKMTVVAVCKLLSVYIVLGILTCSVLLRQHEDPSSSSLGQFSSLPSENVQISAGNCFINKSTSDGIANPEFYYCPEKWNDAAVIAALQASIVASIKPYLRNVKAVALVDHPDHLNRGDSAIWFGEEILFNWLNISIVYKCTNTNSKSHDYCDVANLRKAVEPYLKERTALVAMHGGGNLGDLWKGPEEFRYNLIKKLPDVPILLLPQSIFFKEKKNIQKAKTAYSNAANFTLLVRDRPSFDFVRNHFPGVHTALVPDMALMIGHRPRPIEPTYDILWLRRSDHERIPKFEPPLDGWPLNITVHFGDWLAEVPGLSNPSENTLSSRARIRAFDGFRYLAQGKVVICDRLHAHILSTMMSIPHVVLDNSYGKVHGFHKQWFQCVRSAVLVNSSREAQLVALKLLEEYNGLQC